MDEDTAADNSYSHSQEAVGGSGPGGMYELSLYDLHRQPHPIDNTNQQEIVIMHRSLNSELCCPICLDLLKTTMTTKECLHRFCQECITQALLKGNKECPTCRKKLISKRSLRPDPNFDALIAKIYPSREEYDEMEARALNRYLTEINSGSLQTSIQEGLREQARTRRQRVHGSYHYEKRKRRPKNLDSVSTSDNGKRNSLSPSQQTTDLQQYQVSSDVELILRPHPELVSMESPPHPLSLLINHSRYLRTVGLATVEHLKKYLRIRLELDDEETKSRIVSSAIKTDSEETEMDGLGQQNPQQIEREETVFAIFVCPSIKEVMMTPPANDEGWVKLPGCMDLAEIRSKYWHQKRPLQLFFNVDKVEE